MKKIFLFIRRSFSVGGILLSFYFSEKSFSQNLVANGSFEDENICDEYHANCAPAAWEGTCNETGNIQYGLKPGGLPDGNHFVNILMNQINSTKRTYLQTRLLCPLMAGKKYLLDFYVNTNFLDFKNIDIVFSGKETAARFAHKLADTTFFTMDDGNFINEFDKNDWNEMSLTFTATGNEKFIAIGNMQPYDMNLVAKNTNTHKGEIIYSVDFISLLPIDSNAVCSVDEMKTIENFLYSQHRRHSPWKNFTDADFVMPVAVDTTSSVVIPVSKSDTITLSDILFETDSSELNSAMVYLLDSVAAIINAGNYKLITVIGYTDNVGSDNYNLMLSIHRSASVADYFKNEKQINASLIKNYGMGKRNPVADNSTEEGRSKNRRVEIILEKN